MSYAVIERIITTPIDGKSCTIELYEKGAATPSPIPMFPVTATRLSFQMSKNGFGWLNQTLSLGIVDTAADKYFNLFNNIDSDTYAIRVSLTNDDVSDRMIFWGFPEFQQVVSSFDDNNAKLLSVKFYTPVQFKTRIRYNDSDVQSEITKGQGSTVDARFIRFGQLLADIILNSYPDQRYAYISRLTTARLRGTGWPSTINAALINELFYQVDVVEDTDTPVADLFILALRMLFLRAGQSYTYGITTFSAANMGRQDGEYDVAVVDMDDLINIQTGRLFINACVKTDDVALPVFQKSKIISGITKRDVPPYWSVQYSRKDNVATEVSFLIQNSAEIANPLLYESYSAPNIPFVPPNGDPATPGTLRRAIFPSAGSADAVALDSAGVNPFFFDFDFDNGDLTYELTELLAKSNLSIRNVVGREFNFGYTGILDPMLNYKFSDDTRIYVFTRGEWDLIQQITYINEGFTFEPMPE